MVGRIKKYSKNSRVKTEPDSGSKVPDPITSQAEQSTGRADPKNRSIKLGLCVILKFFDILYSGSFCHNSRSN